MFTPGDNQQHCQKMCRTKKVETVSIGEESCDEVFLGARQIVESNTVP